MPTIVDVAREAGVGLATASRALSGHPAVAAATRQRVLSAAERLGYRPSPLARAFSRRRTSTIELVVPIFTRYYYMEILRGVEAALAATDYAIVIRTIERQEDRDRAFAACCARGRADGVLVISVAPTDLFLERQRATGFPAVLVDSELAQMPSVTVDHEMGATLSTRHCVELGHRRIALVDHPQDPFVDARPGPRQRGYRRVLAEASLEAWPRFERVVEFSPEAGVAAMEDLLSLPDPPTAVIAGSDMQAMGLLDAARRNGYRVPEDISIVGFNDIELAQYLGLTTVRVPMREMGRRAVEMLIRRIENPEAPPEHVHLPTELVVRATCAPPGRLQGEAQQ